jgi:hypothetical protein
VTNGTLSGFSGEGASYQFVVTPSGQGQVVVRVPAGACEDGAGNANSAAAPLARVFDMVAPTVVLASSAPEPTNSSPIPVTATFSEAVAGLGIGGITVTNGTASGLAGAGTTYSFLVTPASQGTVTVRVEGGVCHDAAGNANAASAALSRLYDTPAPTVMLSTEATDPTNVTVIPVTATFSKPVLGFTLSDVAVTNGTAGGFGGTGASYSFMVVPAGQVRVTVSIADAVCQDAAGNTNTAAAPLSLTCDTLPPGVVLASVVPDQTNVSPFPVTATFTEPVTGFALDDVAVTNGTASGFGGSGGAYSFLVTPAGQGLVEVCIPYAAGRDAAANPSTPSMPLSRAYDSVAPAVTNVISTKANGTYGIGKIIDVRITFSEVIQVSGMPLLMLETGEADGVAAFAGGSGTATLIFQYAVVAGHRSPDLDCAGVGALLLAGGAIRDVAGNDAVLLLPAPGAAHSLGANKAIVVDGIAPAVALSTTVSEATNASPIPFAATFTEGVIGFTVGDISVTNGAVGGLTGSGASYRFLVTPAGQGTVAVQIAAGVCQDAAGNGNAAAETLSRTYDTVAPAVVLSCPLPDPTATSPINVTILFSEAVAGLAADDVLVGNGTADGLTGAGTAYTVGVTPAGQGPVTVQVPASCCQDLAGNLNTASTPLARVYDTAAPAVLAQSPPPAAVGVDLEAPLVLSFSEAVFADAGTLRIMNTDGSVFESFPGGRGGLVITGSSVTVYHAPLIAGSAYHVLVDDDCLRDAAGNRFAGIADQAGWGFTARQWEVLFTAGDHGTLTGDTPQAVSHGGDTSPVTVVAGTGYHFTCWTKDGADYATDNPLVVSHVTGDYEFVAVFAANRYTLTYGADEHGTVDGTSPQTVEHGTAGTAMSAQPMPGFQFIRWSDGSTANPRTDANVTGNVTVTAEFAISQYTVTFQPGAHGSVVGGTPAVVLAVTHGAPAPAAPVVTSQAGWLFAGWSPVLPATITTDVETTAQYSRIAYTLAYLAGSNGTTHGATPQTVEYGADGTAVTATPATGYHFRRWSDGRTDNPRTDTDVTAHLTVTAEFEINAYTVAFEAEPNGTLDGITSQAILHGGSTTPVTAVPAPGCYFVLWTDGARRYSTASRVTVTNVTGDMALTALFRQPAPPEGDLVLVADAAEVGMGHGWWDLSGAYATAVGGSSLTLDLAHDTKGKLSGTATYTVAKDATVEMPIKGSVKGASGSITMKGTLKGADDARTVSVSLTLNLTVDTANRQLAGPLTGTVKSGGVTTAVSQYLDLPIAAPMDGTWTLAFQLAQSGTAVTGTAILTLSNGVDCIFLVKGKTGPNSTAILSLAGDPANPTAKAIKIKTTITPLEGGWARIERFFAKGYGQTVAW